MTDIAEAREIDDAPDLDDDEQRERWKVRSDRAASWALRKLRETLDEIERVTLAAGDEIRSLNAWKDAAIAPLARDVNFFEGVLIGYRLELEAKNPALPKTYKVPGGTISRRKSADKIEIVDEDALVRWAIRSGLFEFLKISPLVSKLGDFTPVHEVGICDICEGSIVKDQLTPSTWIHDDEATAGTPEHPATPYIDPQGVLVAGEGADLEIVPGVVHLIREDTYNAKPE